MVKNNKQKILGLTLLELVVSVALFAVLILVATRTFTKITDIQNRTKDEQNIEGDLRYAMGVFTDEVRAASLHLPGEPAPCDTVAACNYVYYCVNDAKDTLYIRDKNNTCVSYYRSAGKSLVVERGGTTYTITSADVTVDSLKFLPSALSDRILVEIKAHGSTDYNKSISYQTAITSTTLR